MKKVLGIAHKTLVWYSVAAAPVCVAYALWSTMVKHGSAPNWLFDNISFAWILSLCYLLAALLFHRQFRELVLTRLAGFKEQDERERRITADSARATFMVMLALEIILLIMSMTTLRVYNKNDGKAYFTVGLSLSSEQLNIYSIPSEHLRESGTYTYAEGRLMPANLSFLLLFMIAAQIGTFQLFARKQYRGS
ncbi:MAG: hypothetical protein WCS77_08850 [Elusimicrobiaceae bacterium]|jgi:hypothetical protein